MSGAAPSRGSLMGWKSKVWGCGGTGSQGTCGMQRPPRKCCTETETVLTAAWESRGTQTEQHKWASAQPTDTPPPPRQACTGMSHMGSEAQFPSPGLTDATTWGGTLGEARAASRPST